MAGKQPVQAQWQPQQDPNAHLYPPDELSYDGEPLAPPALAASLAARAARVGRRNQACDRSAERTQS